jgi:anti-anti-sigma factor
LTEGRSPLKELEIGVETTSGVAHVRFAGKLGVSNGRVLDTILENLRTHGTVRVILDISQVPDLYSATAGVLLRHADAFQKAGGGLLIAGALHPNVALHLELLGLKDRFKVCSDPNEARRRLLAGPS